MGSTFHRSRIRSCSGFTLIELLVVVAIIGLLISILVPSLSAVRKNANRVNCASNLHQVGLAMQSYLEQNDNHLPYASYMPSVSAWPLPTPDTPPQPPPEPDPDLPPEERDLAPGADGAVFLSELLLPYHHTRQLLACPQDVPEISLQWNRSDLNLGKSYYQTERSSYELRMFFAGVAANEIANRYLERRDIQVTPETIWIMRDYNNFHGQAGQNGSRRYLYLDAHVTDFEN